MKKTAVTLAMLSVLYACNVLDKGGKKYFIDNPTNAPLKLVLDGQNIELSAHEYKQVDIKGGSHQLAVAGGAQRSFTIDETQSQKGGMINPLAATYVIWTENYGEKNSYNPLSHTIKWNGEDITGPFKVDSSVYIPNGWSFDVVTPFPKSVQVSNNASSAWKAKIFRAEDFTKEYNEYYKGGGAQQEPAK